MKKLLTLCCIAASLLLGSCTRTADKGSADTSELYGYVNIRLPHIEGMNECHTHPAVMAFTERYRQSGPILGYYLDDATYPRVDSLGRITFDNYFMIYGDYNRENYEAGATDLPLMQEQLERSLVGTNWQELGRRTEEVYNTLMVGQPAILQKYSPQPDVLTMIILMKYRQENGAESTVVSAANCILVKKRLLNMAYYMAYQNASTIDALKQRNDAAVKAFMAAN
jgi:lipoprotein